MRALQCASNVRASTWRLQTSRRCAEHWGQAELLMSSTPPVYSESGKVCSLNHFVRSGWSFCGIAVSNEATSEVRRKISVRNQSLCDRRKPQKGQSSDSKCSACAIAHGGLSSSCETAGWVHGVTDEIAPMRRLRPPAETCSEMAQQK